ncbi:PTS sugar transporter subunit IIA [uncultured Vagococcus sp.]|uniref:BglG family transcription antiterminator n=1 Tax=uncultured Vagococcus sp. TaxID=189676 RepID=UPI0028D11F9C|nr:PTS sugar transporter subunit IIA [uncultured Vagococcus sp.]
MKLSHRELAILDYLLEQEQYVNYKEIAHHHGITERMVRYDIEKIEVFLKKNQLEPLNRSLKKGIMIGKRDELHQLIQTFKQRTTPKTYKYSKDEIEEFILLSLFLAQETTPVSYFEEVLFISRTTVLNNMKVLEAQFRGSSLVLKHVKRKGYKIAGELLERCLSFSDLLLKSINLRELYTFIETDEVVFSKKAELIMFNLFDLEYLSDSYYAVKKLEQYLGKEFEDAYTTLLLTLIYRIQEESEGWELRQFLTKNKGELSETETLLRLMINDSTSVRAAKNQLDVKQSVYELTEIIADYFDQDMASFSATFFTQLTAHVSNMIDRNRMGIKTTNPIYKEIVFDYPDLFKVIKGAVGRLAKTYDIEISNHEISFLVIYFASEIENRHVAQKKKPNVLVVCVEGLAVSKMLQSQLKKVFDFNRIETSSLKKFSAKALDQYDFIISTVEIPDIRSPKIIKINNYLTARDLERLKTYFDTRLLNSKDNGLSHFNRIMETIRENTNEITNLSKLELDLIKILTKKNRLSTKEVIPDIHFSVANISIMPQRLRWEEAIAIGTDGLEKIKATQAAYKKRIMSNIRKHGPYMVIAPKVMIAHAGMEDGVNHAGLWITTLKEGTNLTGNFPEEVQLIITIALKDQTTHRVMENIAKLAFNEDKINSILSSNHAADIYSIVTSTIYK